MEQNKSTLERREVSGFDKLLFKAVGQIELSQGPLESLSIEGQSDLRDRIITQVIDRTLVISSQNDWYEMLGISLHGPESLRFHLCMPRITALTITGMGQLTSMILNAQDLSLSLAGPGSMRLAELTTQKLAVNIAGVGSIQVSGKTDSQTVHISGAGCYRSSSLESQRSLIDLSGVGNASIYARQFLDVAISGAGDIEYRGHPQVTRKISGLGMLKYIEDGNYSN